MTLQNISNITGDQNANADDDDNASRIEAEIPIIEPSNEVSHDSETAENQHKDRDTVKVPQNLIVQRKGIDKSTMTSPITTFSTQEPEPSTSSAGKTPSARRFRQSESKPQEITYNTILDINDPDEVSSPR